MKKYINNTVKLIFLAFVSALSFVACEEENDGKYEMTDGLPEIYYVRMTDPNLADSLLVGAFLKANICLVGNNLTSIQEVYFNDQKATLNINFITNNTLILNVPENIPNVVTNKIYMVTGKGDTVAYDFKVGIPAPVVSKVKCEHVPAGGEVVVNGDYFFDYPDDPIEITIGSYKVPYEDIVSVSKTKLTFISPPEDVKGYISILTAYGSNTRSYKDIFRDMSGLITGFEADENGGTGFVGGWGRPAPEQIQEDPEYALTGKYVVMEGTIEASDWASISSAAINIWSCDNTSNPNTGIPNPMFIGEPEKSVLKLEVNVLRAWSGLPMIFAFANANDNEGWLWADETQPRAFWAPWKDAEGGSYVSGGWETVVIPLADMKFNGAGETVGLPAEFGQLGIQIHNRGGLAYVGTSCNPLILIDNVRVVSME